jgi:hypothetical protein
MTLTPHSHDKRNHPRLPVKLRVDAKLLPDSQWEEILAGHGYRDLDQESLSLRQPRHGHHACETFDLSASGLRLSAVQLEGLEKGSSVELDMHLPGERRVVKLLAEVMWAEKGSDHPLAGLRFAALEDEGERLVRFAELTDETVCLLIVNGLGYIITRPSGDSRVRSSERKSQVGS